MKTRIGFVSNSSSSSFVLITSKAKHEYILSTMKRFDRKVIDYMATVPFVFLGKEVVQFKCVIHSDCGDIHDCMGANIFEEDGNGNAEMFGKNMPYDEVYDAVESAVDDYKNHFAEGDEDCIINEEDF